MKIVVFTLTMPNCGSWNNRWSGSDRLYAKARRLYKENLDALKFNLDIPRDFYYTWGDGWTACVHVEVMSSKDATKYLKNSRGFYGYDWMIDSILQTGTIAHRV